MVALAGTALPFAHSAQDEAERWLRALRLHGEVGAALQGLGVGEAPLVGGDEAGRPTRPSPPLGPEVLEDVTRQASEYAAGREAETVSTADLTFAVLDVYGDLFERVLYQRGTSREELTERLTAAGAAEAPELGRRLARYSSPAVLPTGPSGDTVAASSAQGTSRGGSRRPRAGRG